MVQLVLEFGGELRVEDDEPAVRVETANLTERHLGLGIEQAFRQPAGPPVRSAA
ncbi:hypothetical protein [Sorangium sp. So ce1389]|uniref:hypothetical protein n=1 Tax=Sorangium sp. So ce1389 TaxID=3133336 RepID=UPI003F5D8858